MDNEQMYSDILDELQTWQGTSGGSATGGGTKAQATYASGFERAVDPSRRAHRADTLKVSILGGGNGGMAMAGHMAILGYEITIWSPFSWEVEPIEEKGGVSIIGSEVSGFGKIAKVTRSLDVAVKGADLIMICAPAMSHKPYASMLAPLLRDGQVVVLNPGRTGGSLEFARTLTRFACSARIVLGETQTFIYAAERTDAYTVKILKEKFRMRAAALPASDNDLMMEPLRDLYPQIEPAQNVLETGLNNVAPVVHPGTVLLNTSVLERTAAGEPLKFYQDQVTPTIATLIMGKLDQEKQAVARALGLKEVWSLLDWYRESYHIVGDNIFDVIRANPYIAGFTAPSHILAQNHILDDVPNSLVPIADFGRVLGVPTPTVDSMVHLASAMCSIDWWEQGRTVSGLGLGGMSVQHMIEHVEHTALGGKCSESGVCRAFGFYS
ncbi:MAG: NAD/NADP octopine/nopaline dehydrogenase family protein [Acidimicrobiia bacterium]|nr:NAD/NADP octopine/nopaline dehydrogenase family protein [Acidimicrobiia bacterium]